MNLRSLLETLRFRGARPELLDSLSDEEWRQLLAQTDRTALTFALDDSCRAHLPEWVRQQIDAAAARNKERWRRTRAAYVQLANAFDTRGLEHVVLKGFSHCPDFCRDPGRRVQYDLDLWVQSTGLEASRDAVLGQGYEPIEGMESYPTDHLPTMLLRNGWKWRGDVYDPEIPVSVEVHFRLWDESTERLTVEGVDSFWPRREAGRICEFTFPALCRADRLAYAAMHAMRHLLRGDLRAFHVYEIGEFLHRSAGDEGFWIEWRGMHSASLRSLQAVAFAIAHAWFACDLADAVREEIDRLPADVRRWLEAHAFSPLDDSRKTELWLHLSLVPGLGDRLSILRRRLLPIQIPGPGVGVEVPPDERSLALRIEMRRTQGLRILERSWHHARTLLPTLADGILWWFRRRGIDAAFGRFLLAACLFEAGMFVFVLLYNIYLIDLGFTESSLGLFAGAMTAGSLAGTLPAGIALRRFPPNRVLQFCFLGGAIVCALRASTNSEPLLALLAFLAGAILSVWAVSIPPTIAGLAEERGRPLAFSLFGGTGIGIGVIAGPLGGWLPRWLTSLHVPNPVFSALLAGCALIAFAAWPASRLRFQSGAVREEKTQRHSLRPFQIRYLVAFAIWSLATGIFNPFFNVYFSKHLAFRLEDIGWVFSGAQLLQVAAILASPVLFRRFGLIGGIAATQALTGVALGLLAFASPAIAVPAYMAYMTFQYMNTPGLFTLLMNRVESSDRGSASARYFFVSNAAQAIAAAGAGLAFVGFGYPATLVSAAIGALLAALLFRTLLSSRAQISS